MSYKYEADRYRTGFRWRSANHKNMRMAVTPRIFREMDMLYHYTSMKNALSILATKVLFMGELSNMNDINESYRPIADYFDGENIKPDKIKAAEDELRNYKQFSFTIDGKLPGFAIPSMWGHYAEKGYGICIVFNQEALIKRLRETGGYLFDKVVYTKDIDNCITIQGDPKTYFEENASSIFFHKSDDWQYEQEYRVIRREIYPPAMIDISGCVIAVVMCFADGDDNHDNSVFSTMAYRRLKKLFPDIPVLELSNGVCGSNLRDAACNQWHPEPEAAELDCPPYSINRAVPEAAGLLVREA